MATQEAAIDTRTEAVAGTEIFETLVIGGGQAGLSVGYYLKKRGGSSSSSAQGRRFRRWTRL